MAELADSILISFQLKGLPIAVLGGSDLNLPKLRLLCESKLTTLLYSDHPSELTLQWLNKHPEIKIYPLSDIGKHNIALAFVGWELIRNNHVRVAANELICPTNFIDQKANSDFFVPALINRGKLQVGIASNGSSPALVSKLRSELEAILPASLEVLIDTLHYLRKKLPSGKKHLIKKLLPKIVEATAKQPSDEIIEQLSQDMLKPGFDTSCVESDKGIVGIVGAGPGDPDLLTNKANFWLSQADVILHDQLVPESILNRARRDAKLINVGKFSANNTKARFGQPITQDNINILLFKYATDGKIVCRLKAGDPLIFARGGEEILFLSQQGIAVEVVPGISAFQAAASASLVPSTFRLVSDSLLIATGHQSDGKFALDFEQLKFPRQTVAIFMAKYSVANFVTQALKAGVSKHLPVALVFNASLPSQYVEKCELATLPNLVNKLNREGIDGPVIYLLGKTVDILPNPTLASLASFNILKTLGEAEHEQI